ncbi:hypothetical protein BJX76DRAFT_333755 [Aspergillus varians]
MDFERHELSSGQPKRRRRNYARNRLRNKAPISARLSLDNHLRGSVGVVSDDLANDLFQPSDPIDDFQDNSVIRYIAISPYLPGPSSVEALTWTVVPVRPQSAGRSNESPLPNSTIIFPESADSLQPFVRALSKLDPTRQSQQTLRLIEIRVLDVVPLPLDTIYVTVERDLLRNHDDVQSKFGGGFTSNANGPNGLWPPKPGKTSEPKRYSKRAAAEVEGRLTAAVREALGTQRVVHTGDSLPLPLPPHPITYAPAPPALISFCEPVSQGLLLPATKIVLIQARPHGNRPQRNLRAGSGFLKQVAEDEADDTSNEQFYSAAEDKPVDDSTEMESTSNAEESESETEGSGGNMSDTSDDSLDDMISLSAPELPQPVSGVMSGMTSATPRGRRMDGIHTPGSIVSNLTSSTLRPGRQSGGKVFKAEGLLHSITNELLYPSPRDDDDEEAVIFVDINTLAKIGCFSGDWVRIEASEELQANIFASIKLGSFNEPYEDGDWRAVKIYGLPGLPSPKPRYSIKQSGDRRQSISQRPGLRMTPSVFVPPILLNNIDNPKYIRISPMNLAAGIGGPKSGVLHQMKTATRSPPLAKEVTLLKVSTPLSMDRVLQPALFAGLKQYFETKRRLLKSGDLLGISIDENLGRAVFAGTAANDGAQDDDITIKLGPGADTDGAGVRKVGVAWFRVGQVIPSLPDDQDDISEFDWGGVAVIDSATTRMVQAGSDISRIPNTLNNGWEYWLGTKSVPKPVVDAQTIHGVVTELPQPFISPVQQRVRDLMAVATSSRAIQLGMKPVVILLRSQQRHIGKASLATRACADIGLHTFPIDVYDILTEGGANGGDVKTEAYLKARAERAFHCGADCTALLIKHIEVLTADRIVSAMTEILADARVIIATTTDVEQIPEGIRSMFTHEFEITAPEEKEREGILRNAVSERSIKLAPDVDLGTVALKTAALVAGDLVDVVERASVARSSRLEKLADTACKQSSTSKITVRDVLLAGGEAVRGVTKLDFDSAVDAARKNFADSIGAPKIPNVSWEDVGGLTNVKDALVETIQLPLERPELFAKGMKKRSGILFYGPPGTGKTLLAKAIATEFSLNFFSIKGPELLNMYIGESEANVRRVFQRARDARPCVVFFDELDSVAPKRGNQGDSGGVMDRIVSQLLAELDGMNGGEENSGGVFVIGATNRPDLLDTALLRPGRFDKMLYLGVSDTHEKQATILEALTRKFALASDLSLSRVSERLPLTYTGADLYALCSDAMLKAITRKATAVDEKIQQLPGGPVSTAYFFDHLSTPDDVAVMVTEEDFDAARGELVPSVRYVSKSPFHRGELVLTNP